MITVADVARELHRPDADVLDACAGLDIVASSPASGLSSTEHRRLRDHFGGDDELLGAVPRGSTDTDPHGSDHESDTELGTWDTLVAERRQPPAPDSIRLPFHRRISPRKVIRVTVLAFGVIAIGAALIGLRDRDTGSAALCIDFEPGGGTASVDCAVPHDAEIVATIVLVAPEVDAAYPGEAELRDEAGDRCPDPADLVAGEEETALAAVYLVPTADRWAAGDRLALCLVEDPSAQLIGPLTP